MQSRKVTKTLLNQVKSNDYTDTVLCANSIEDDITQDDISTTFSENHFLIGLVLNSGINIEMIQLILKGIENSSIAVLSIDGLTKDQFNKLFPLIPSNIKRFFSNHDTKGYHGAYYSSIYTYTSDSKLINMMWCPSRLWPRLFSHAHDEIQNLRKDHTMASKSSAGDKLKARKIT